MQGKVREGARPRGAKTCGPGSSVLRSWGGEHGRSVTLQTSFWRPQPKRLGKVRFLRTPSSSPALWSAKDHVGRNRGSKEPAGGLHPNPGRAANCLGAQPLLLEEVKRLSVLHRVPTESQDREAGARGWSILCSNWLVAPPFITGKEGRPGTRGGRELFHRSFPGAEGPVACPGSLLWGRENVCAW